MRSRKFLIEQIREDPLEWFQNKGYLIVNSSRKAPRKDECKAYVFVNTEKEIILSYPTHKSLHGLRVELQGLSARITPLKVNFSKNNVIKDSVSLILGNGQGNSVKGIEGHCLPNFASGTKRKAPISVSEIEKELSQTTLKQVKKEDFGGNQSHTLSEMKLEEFLPGNHLEIADLRGRLVKAHLIIDLIRAFGSDPITLVNDITFLLLQAKKE
jgi:hypothetical protein